MKYIRKVSILLALVSALSSTAVYADFEWAEMPVDFCINKQIITGDENGDLMLDKNITREQMAKMLVQAYSLKTREAKEFLDVDENSWSYQYICDFSGYMIKNSIIFDTKGYVTREEFISHLLVAAGYEPYSGDTNRLLQIAFSDSDEIDDDYRPYVLTAVMNEFLLGSDMKINPKGLLTRAEACAFFYRVMNAKNTVKMVGVSKAAAPVVKTDKKEIEETKEVSGNQQTYSNYGQTPIMGESTVSLEQAKRWAESKGAHQRFIDIADLYWYYGEVTGIRPEVLYAQAAKETAYGKYTGKVVPEQNNWAGIKAKGATGDATYDHETFATPDDGVRAHFNHMGAYLGIEPVGEPHGRYASVKSLSWAGEVKYIEELGGKWAPHADYGVSIIRDFLEPMQNA